MSSFLRPFRVAFIRFGRFLSNLSSRGKTQRRRWTPSSHACHEAGTIPFSLSSAIPNAATLKLGARVRSMHNPVLETKTV